MNLPYYLQVTDEVLYGDSKLFRIRLNPEHKDDTGLLAHEYEHVKQWYIGFGLGLVIALITYLVFQREDYTFYALCIAPFWKDSAYTFIKPARLFLEVQAVVAQIKRILPPEHKDFYIEYFAERLSKDYGLSTTAEVIAKKIRRGLE
jgi:hypothetical protein